MKSLLYIFTFLLLLSSCGSRNSKNVRTKKTSRTSKNRTTTKITKSKTTRYPKTTNKASSKTVNNIVRNAKTNKGVRYKMGGTTKSGMDCSGLLYTAFKKEAVNLPRTSGQMATAGKWVDVKKVQKGDLLFFATNKKTGRKINHVGLVTESRTGYVKFIHSTSSRGVIESELSEKYWYFAFVQARRVL